MKLTYYHNPNPGGVLEIYIVAQDGDVVLQSRPFLYASFHYKTRDMVTWDSGDLNNNNQEFLVYDTPLLGVEIFWLNDYHEHVGYVDGNRHIMKIHKYHKIPMVNVRSIDVTP